MSLHEPDLAFLGEITNIGAGNAATAMSTFLKSSFGMEPPTVHQLTVADAVQLLGDGEDEVTAALLTVTGKLSGLLALFVPDPTPFLAAFEAPPELAPEMIGELGNIVAARFMGAIEAMIGIGGYPEPPGVATASRGAILETILAISAQQEPIVLFRARLTAEGGGADLVFIPTVEAVALFQEMVS